MARKFHKPKHLRTSAIARAKDSIKIEPNSLLSFSYKYFLVEENKFDPYSKDLEYFNVLTDRLRELSRLTPQEFYSSRSKSLRSHPIDWDETSENSFAIPNEENLVSIPYQFEVSANEHGRVHGFLIDSVFYVRWLDPDHNLYS